MPMQMQWLCASSAASDVKDRFGIADEVRFWSGVALAVAAGSAVAGILQHMEANKASDAYDKLSGLKIHLCHKLRLNVPLPKTRQI